MICNAQRTLGTRSNRGMVGHVLAEDVPQASGDLYQEEDCFGSYLACLQWGRSPGNLDLHLD